MPAVWQARLDKGCPCEKKIGIIYFANADLLRRKTLNLSSLGWKFFANYQINRANAFISGNKIELLGIGYNYSNSIRFSNPIINGVWKQLKSQLPHKALNFLFGWIRIGLIGWFDKAL